MSRKEALEYLKANEALDMAIKVLEQPCVTMKNLSDEELKHFAEEMKKARPQVIQRELCDDAISRQAAQAKIKSICDEYRLSYEDGERKAATGGSAYALGHAFDDLPPVTPTRKTGKWICFDKDRFPINPHCTNCGGEPYFSNDIHQYKYCPYCGTEMESGEQKLKYADQDTMMPAT